ncbi:MAG: phosphatidate cytidylyltransferase [Mucilaginibacter sp.]
MTTLIIKRIEMIIFVLKTRIRMTSFVQRTITGIVVIIMILPLINVGVYGYEVLVFCINFGGMLEFYRLAPITKSGMLTGLLLGVTMLFTLGSILAGIAGWRMLLIHVPVIFVVYLVELYSNNSKPFENLAYTFMGILYVTLPLCFFTAIAFLPYGGGYHPTIVSGCFFMLWANDTGAYLYGKYLGRHPLFERISPHKTWGRKFGRSVYRCFNSSNYFALFYNFEYGDMAGFVPDHCDDGYVWRFF